MLSEAMVFGGDLNGDQLQEHYENWTIIIYKISGFMSAICFILIASYIAYYKSLVKVDALQHMEKMAFYCIWTFLGVGLVHTTFVTYFAASEDIIDNTDDQSYTNLH